MDYMGTGRPIVSTALPECRLYDHLFHVAAGADEFVAAVRAILDARSDDGRAGQRFDWARRTPAAASSTGSSTGSRPERDRAGPILPADPSRSPPSRW